MSLPQQFSTVEDFVQANDGTRAIKKILLANNGISAVKAMRSIRRWAYDTFSNDKIITFVAMATPEDLVANAEYIRMADEYVEVPGGGNANNYANVQLIISLAVRYKVDAVFAGWGHASENPALPDGLLENNIVFMGPSSGPMFALGDKIGSTIIAQSAGVPVIPWSGDGLVCNYKRDGEIASDVYRAANITSVEECIAAVNRVGLPVMIKASEGGGGKGIRKVMEADQVETAFRQVQNEVPGSPIFVMQVAFGARHLEVQLLADSKGNAVALNGRDCSVQRRHQKILEEGPANSPPAHVWREMERAAVRLAKEVNYCNAGTVEYLYKEADQTFCFLELNPRLQVEHPVTEMITGVNLPAAQLQVAMGLGLDRIGDVRVFFQHERNGTSVIDFDESTAIKPHGHCIAARITAENPHKNFQPTSGKVTELNFRSTKNVWAYFSIDNSGNIHEFADSQLGHVFAWGETREEARRNLVVSLKTLTIRGDIRTTIEYLIDLIELEDYKVNSFHTAWLDERIAIGDVQQQATLQESLQVVLIGAACEAHCKATQREQDFLASLERGQMPPLALLQQRLVGLEIIFRNAKYVLDVARCSSNQYAVSLTGGDAITVQLDVRQLADGGYIVVLAGQSHVAYLRNEVGARRLVLDGETHLFLDEYDPTVIRAAMGGKIVRSLVEDGQLVKQNAPFCEIEVMKMTMPLMVPEEGKVYMQKHAGSVMQPGDVIAKLELADPSKVKRAERFTGKLDQTRDPQPELDSTRCPHLVLQSAEQVLRAVMTGFAPPQHIRKRAMKQLVATYLDPKVCMLEVRDLFARLRRNLPPTVQDEIIALCDGFELDPEAAASLDRQQAFAVKIESLLVGSVGCDQLVDLVRGYTSGRYVRALNLLQGLLSQYSAAEEVFAELALSDSAEKDDVMQELRRKYAPKQAYELSLSHSAVQVKNEIAVQLLGMVEKLIRLEEEEPTNGGEGAKIRIPAVALLRKVSGLRAKEASEVALEARQMLIELQHPTFAERLQLVEQALQTSQGVYELAQSTNPVLHMLIGLLCDKGTGTITQQAALQAYVQRVYQTYKIKDLVVDHAQSELGNHAMWTFYSEPDAVSFHMQSSQSPLGEEALEDNTTPRSSSPGLESFGSSRNLRARAGSDQQLDEITTQGEDYLGQLKANAVPPFIARKASLCVIQNGFPQLEEKFQLILDTVRIDKDSTTKLTDGRELIIKQDVQVLHIILRIVEGDEVTPDSISDKLSVFLRTRSEALQLAGVRRVTFAVPPVSGGEQHEVISGHGSSFFTFRRRTNWSEDRLVRHIEPSLAYQLDLKRLSNFNISRVPLGKRDLEASRTVHVYRATPKTNKPGNMAGTRLFVRALVRQTNKVDGQTEADSYPGPERVLVQAISAIEAVQDQSVGTARNHIFLNVLGEAQVEPQVVERMAGHLGRRYAARLAVCRVGQVELRVNAKFDMGEGDGSIPVRIIAHNPTGFGLRVDSYVEAADPTDPEHTVLYSISEGDDGGASGALALMGLAPVTTPNSLSSSSISQRDDFFDNDLETHSSQAPELHGQDAQTPYPVSSLLEERRTRALASGTAYCYDFPSIFHKALERTWHQYMRGRRGVDLPSPSTICQFEELVLSEVEIDAPGLKPIAENTLLSTTTRSSGNNTMAMVAWRATLKTPQYPEGRQFILIANDITMDAGSFGTQEDNLFLEASKLARTLRIPRLYIAANSGARIGMADEVKKCFQVAWVDETNPNKGFQYIYLSADAYKLLGPEGRNSVICDKEPIIVSETGEVRYRISSIVGEGRDLGVENLRGSGLIAGETSRAYDETFTLTYVAGRSVGIGAYLVRLGQRTIQKGRDAPLLLTGYQALNTLVGQPVYSSNLQLGGPGIMYSNGVSHQCVRNDLEGVAAMLQWLSFVPEFKGAALPLTRLLREDPVDRDVAYPQRDEELTGADPRLLLTGVETANEWTSGLFDRGSFQEYLGGWAKTIITGRARLGGIPVGVIIPECRSVTTRIPADPAQPDSTERVVVQAGNVWYPDSSYKTASSIRDINREGLPLVFLINIRGFSGGQRDMYDSVLKFGSMIVDALVEFKQPVLVYIPKKSELRGGAWVVVDPTINENVMEMWCEETARGGVLEAAGAASIKFRQHDQLAAAHRLDPVLRALDEQVAKTGSSPEITDKIKQREKLVLPVYSQLATEFADAHDRPGRMLAKGVVNGVVQWKTCRQFLYRD
ncbi:hypothetical protein BASA81_006610 [Batrachochytrium salamandrivorans]|nr:hypothetical protein BASA81_006610 [Batrachochytrium salamandrivorans]